MMCFLSSPFAGSMKVRWDSNLRCLPLISKISFTTWQLSESATLEDTTVSVVFGCVKIAVNAGITDSSGSVLLVILRVFVFFTWLLCLLCAALQWHCSPKYRYYVKMLLKRQSLILNALRFLSISEHMYLYVCIYCTLWLLINITFTWILCSM